MDGYRTRQGKCVLGSTTHFVLARPITINSSAPYLVLFIHFSTTYQILHSSSTVDI